MAKPKNAKQAIRAAGPVISAKELRQIESKFGSNAVAKAKEYAKETPGVKFGNNAKTVYQASKTSTSSIYPGLVLDGNVTPGAGPGPWAPAQIIPGGPGGPEGPEGPGGPGPGNQTPFYLDIVGGGDGKNVIPAGRYSEQEYNTLSTAFLARLAGDIEIEKEQVRGLYTTRQQEIASSASKYGYDRDLEAKKYIADQDLLKNTRVAEIEGQKKIDLQAIINAGLKDIEGIRGQTERDVETLRGEFGVKQESERQRGQKDIARIGSEAGFRNALISAFSF